MPDTQALLNAINAAESGSYGADDGGDLSADRAGAIDRYLGRNINPAPDQRSQVRSRDVYETLEWIKPSLLRIFVGSGEIVKFEPQGPEDEQAARQESDYTNYVVTQKNNWHQICHDWFTDALMVKNGYVYAFWDDSKHTEKEKYYGQSDEGLAMLMQDGDVKVVGHNEYPDEEDAKQQEQAFAQAMQQYEAMAVQAMQQGMEPPPPPQMQPPRMLHDVELSRTREAGQVKLSVLPPERCKISERTPDFTLMDCDYFEFWEMKSISDLRAMGFKVEDTIGDDGHEIETSEDEARDIYNEQSWNRSDDRLDKSMRRVRVRSVWIRYDYDGDGISEMQYCIVVGNEILFREDCGRIPVSCICPVPMPHRHIGLSIADAVIDLEDMKTAIFRQGIDNIFLSNNQRTAFNENTVNVEDLLNNVPGSNVRVNGTPGQHLMPLVVPSIFAQAIEGMEYLDQIRQNRVGVGAYFTGTDSNAINKTASGVAQLTSSSAQRVEMIARLFAVGVEILFGIVHELILKHGHKSDVIKLRNQWVQVDPAQWKKRTDMRITVGLGTGSKEGVLANLAQIFQTQMMVLQAGIGIVEPPNIYKTVVEQAKAAGFSAAENFYSPPKPPQPQGPPPEVMLEQMKQQFEAQDNEKQRQFDMVKLQIQDGTKNQIAELQSETQRIIASFNGYIEQMNNQFEATLAAQKDETGFVREQISHVQKMQESAQKPLAININEEAARNTTAQVEQIMAAMQAFSQSISGLQQQMTMPRQVVRGPDGRVSGVQVGDVQQRVVRGQDGKIVGLQ